MATSFKQIYYEALSLKQVKKNKLTKKYSGAYQQPFIDKLFGDKDRLIFPIEIDKSNVINDENPLYINIYNFLRKYYPDITIIPNDYIQGIAYKYSDNERKQPFKIGRLLNKVSKKDPQAEKLLSAFQSDPSRSAKSSKNYLVVISRHPYDVAGMSTDRNWTSCMNLGGKGIHYYKKQYVDRGSNAHYIRNDISEGTLIVYLVNPNDRHSNGKISIQHPLSRIALKPYKNKNDEKDLAYAMGPTYGADIEEFKEFIYKWLKETVNVDTQDKLYYLPQNLYSDNSTAVGFTTTNIQKSIVYTFVMYELEHYNAKYLDRFVVDASDSEYGRSLKISIKYPIPTDVPLSEFDFEYNFPQNIKNILKFGLQPFKDFSRGVNTTFVRVHSNLQTRMLTLEYLKDDNYFDQGKEWDEDQEEDYWNSMIQIFNLRVFRYDKSYNAIIDILKSNNIDEIKQQELITLKREIDSLTHQTFREYMVEIEKNYKPIISRIDKILDLKENNPKQFIDKMINYKLDQDYNEIKDYLQTYHDLFYNLYNSHPQEKYEYINPQYYRKDLIYKQIGRNSGDYSSLSKKIQKIDSNVFMIHNREYRDYIAQNGLDKYFDATDDLKKLLI